MRTLWLACTALALLVGCHDRALKVCDITQSDCQQDIYYADLGYAVMGTIPLLAFHPFAPSARTSFAPSSRTTRPRRHKRPPRTLVGCDARAPGPAPSTGDTQARPSTTRCKTRPHSILPTHATSPSLPTGDPCGPVGA